MSDLEQLFEINARWAEAINREDPDFFAKLARQHATAGLPFTQQLAMREMLETMSPPTPSVH